MKSKLREVVHKRCGGKIAVVSDNTKIVNLYCLKCSQLWKGNIDITIAEDMRLIKTK